MVNGLIDRVADAGRCDVVTDIARPYLTPIMCALLGAPREDWALFADWTEEVFKALNFQPDATFDETAIAAICSRQEPSSSPIPLLPTGIRPSTRTLTASTSRATTYP